jgi:hypothetical protein
MQKGDFGVESAWVRVVWNQDNSEELGNRYDHVDDYDTTSASTVALRTPCVLVLALALALALDLR